MKPGLSTSQDDYIRDIVSCVKLKGTGCEALNTPLGPTVGLQKISGKSYEESCIVEVHVRYYLRGVFS